MGDVIHNLPVVADIVRAHPDAQIDWVVEEAYAGLVRLHPRVQRVIPVAWRRWRRSWWQPEVRDEFRAFKQTLREVTYDAIIDTQSLFKSALFARLAHGPRYGYSARGSREGLASWFYDHRMEYARVGETPSVERYRALAGWALGYAPEGEPRYGLAPTPRRPDWLPGNGPYAVFLSATARAEKLWGDANWQALTTQCIDRGWACAFAWGSASERTRAEGIVHAANAARASQGDGTRQAAGASGLAASTDASAGGAFVAPQAHGLVEWAEILAGAAVVVGVDTGLTFLAAAVGVPTIAIYCATSPVHVGIEVDTPHANLGDIGAPPSVQTVAENAFALARGVPALAPSGL